MRKKTLITTDKQSDIKAFMKLYVANEKRLYGFIKTLVPNWSDIDDIVQETVAVMWEKFETFDRGTDFSAWAFTIARFQILNYRKRKNNQRLIFNETIWETLAEKAKTPSLGSNKRSETLEKCIRQLKPEHQKLLELRYRPGTNIDSIAEKMEKTVHAIYKSLNRIHHQLVACVREKMNVEEAL